MKIRRILAGIIVQLFFVGIAIGQGDSVISLNYSEAIEYALAHNYDYLNAAIDIEKAKKRVWETTAMGLPQVSTTFSYSYIPGDLPEFNFGGDQGDGGGAPAIPADVDTAFYEQFMASYLELMGGGGEPMVIANRNSGTWDITVSQLIFSGEYIVGLQTAKTYKTLSLAAYEKAENETRANISSAYFSCLIVKENLEILEQNLQIMETTVHYSQQYLKQGFIDSIAYNQVQLIKATLQNTLMTIERQLYQMKSLLKIQLGMDIQNELVLTEEIDMFIADDELLTLAGSEFVLEQNTDYQLLLRQEQLQEKMVSLEKSRYLPSISGFYMHQKKLNAPDLDFTIPNMLGISASWTLMTSGSRNAKLKQANLELVKTRNSKMQASQLLMMQFDQAKYDLLTSYEKYQIQRQNRDLAKSVFEKTSIKYNEGVAGNDDLLDAQSQFLEAQSTYYTTLLELYNAKININKALNNL